MFEYRKGDGDWDIVKNETKSTLEHDLIHYALETQVGLKYSFFGLLASGKSYAELSSGLGSSDPLRDSEIVNTERVVGVLTAVMKDLITPIEAMESFNNLYNSYHEPLPPWLIEESIRMTQECFRKLKGQWSATPFHSPMTLTFSIL